MKLKHIFLVFSLLYSFLALAITQDSELEDSDESVSAPAPTNSENMTTRLKEEMNYLHQTVEGPSKIQVTPSAKNQVGSKTPMIDDLEEKINFRSAAVKKADNHESEVNVDELDSENFE